MIVLLKVYPRFGILTGVTLIGRQRDVGRLSSGEPAFFLAPGLLALAQTVEHFLPLSFLLERDAHVDTPSADRGCGQRLVSKRILGHARERFGCRLEEES